MKKNKLSLLVAITFMCAVMGIIFVANNNLMTLGTFATNRVASTDEYTLTLDSHNRIANDNSVLTSAGNKVYFDTENDVNINPTSGWFGFADESSGSVFNVTAIKGMKSISLTMDYNEIYLYFGYKEDGIIHYSNWYNMTGTDEGDGQYSFNYSFDEACPSYFKIQCYSNNRTIDVLTIQYSCEEDEIMPTELSSFSSFTYLSEEDAYRVDGLVTNRKKMQTLIVPGTYNGKPVVEINANAFYLNWDIKYVIISEGIKRIGNQAFYLDASLEYIVLPSTIESIGTDAFAGCAGLTSFTIPAATTSISLSAYAGNQFLEEIIVEDGNPTYYSDNGMLYEKATDKLLICPAGKTGTVVIPNTCKAIGSVAFKNSKATSISIGSGVTDIEETFNTCNSLTNFVVNSNNNYFSVLNNTLLCDSLGGVLYAYARGNSAQSITMPSSVRQISDRAFEKVSNLTAINLSSTTHIGEEAFASMPNLENIGLVSAVQIGTGAFKNNPKLKTVTLGSNLQVIPEEAFMNCTALKSISFPHSITTIGNKAFKGCTSLNNLDLPDYALTTLGNEVFMDCTALAINVAIPDSVTSCGSNVFKHSGVTNFTFEARLDYIPDGMFWDCDLLTSITIPDFIKTIGYDAFRECNSLTDVTILDNSVETIRSRAFYHANLSKIYIPKCVTLIEGSALAEPGMMEIYTDVTTPSGYGDEYSSSTAGGGWLRPGWSEGLGGGNLLRIHYNRSRSYYNSL